MLLGVVQLVSMAYPFPGSSLFRFRCLDSVKAHRDLLPFIVLQRFFFHSLILHMYVSFKHRSIFLLALYMSLCGLGTITSCIHRQFVPVMYTWLLQNTKVVFSYA
uniref:Uncharacterized protein n=1 Tax=Kalanchoe fedtschenkoi TaxID=63787 RepID=A0A7N0ZYR4_KALFE